MKNIDVNVQWQGREEARLVMTTDSQGQIMKAKLTGIGGPSFIALLTKIRSQLKGRLIDLPLPEGLTPEVLCIREVILKAKGEWVYPYTSEELCHCRAVPTAVVDQAICVGAHTTRKVSEQTSASTACGTCRPDVEAIINFRLNQK